MGMDKEIGAMVELGGDPQNPFTSMVSGVSKALIKMQDMLGQEGVPEELVAKLGEIEQQYKALLQQIMQSVGQGAPQGQQPAPAKSVNAGPGARPAL